MYINLRYYNFVSFTHAALNNIYFLIQGLRMHVIVQMVSHLQLLYMVQDSCKTLQ